MPFSWLNRLASTVAQFSVITASCARNDFLRSRLLRRYVQEFTVAYSSRPSAPSYVDGRLRVTVTMASTFGLQGAGPSLPPVGQVRP